MDIEKFKEQTKRSSMCSWWPKVEKLEGIPMPKTWIISCSTIEYSDWVALIDGKENKLTDILYNLVKEKCDEFGYPCFVRTDQASAKHDWENSCYISSPEVLRKNLGRVVEFNLMNDLPIGAIVVRQHIRMDTMFKAFYGNMPVNPEYRLFVRNGKVECFHWYWLEDCIDNPNTSQWKHGMKLAKFATRNDVDNVILPMAAKLAQVLEGYWSLDFCRSERGDWYFIDAAAGELSWHPKHENE